MLAPKLYWTPIINLIIQKYLYDTAICIIWPEAIEFDLNTPSNVEAAYTIVNIKRPNLRTSFENDIVDYAARRKGLIENNVVFNDFVEKLTMSIEKTHCESFLVFQTDILDFIEAFVNASRYSIWRSVRNKFIFGYYEKDFGEEHFQHEFFTEQPNILLIASPAPGAPDFKLQTNKFVGPRAENQASLILLDQFYASSERFKHNTHLFPDKLSNLAGREVVLAVFDYRPDVVLGYDNYRNVRNLAYDEREDEGFAFLDGVEAQYLLTFCLKHNCTVEIDTSDADDWGTAYPNMTGVGALGMVARRKAEITLGAMYTWYEYYLCLDLTMYLRRSGITCVVPAPKRLASWLLPIEPFQPVLWACVAGCICIEILALLYFSKLERSILAQGGSWYKSFNYGLGTALKLFVSQSDSAEVRTISLRVVLLACFLIDIVVTSIYGGGLSSILTIPSYEQAADTVELLDAFQLQWAGNSEAWVTSIKASDDPRLISLLKNFRIQSDEELQQLSEQKEMAFTLERLPFGHFAVGDYLTPEALQRFKLMQEDIYFEFTVAFVSRLWALLEPFNQLIYMWHSSGFDKFFEWRVVADYLNVQKQKQIEASGSGAFEDIGPVKLGMSNFAGILVIWFLGVALALMVFLGELIVQRLKQNRQVQSRQMEVFDWDN